jgi:chromosome segregation ATPase
MAMAETAGPHPRLTEDAIAVQATLEKFMRLEQERDALKLTLARERDSAEKALKDEHAARLEDIAERDRALANAEATIEALRAELAARDSVVAEANMKRDEAIADRAVFEVLFIAIRAVMEKFEFPKKALADLRREQGEGAEAVLQLADRLESFDKIAASRQRQHAGDRKGGEPAANP